MTAVEPDDFRRVLGQYPTGVTVVAALNEEEGPIGLTLGTFSAVSLDPPLVSFFVDMRSTTWPKVWRAGNFCANVLAADQDEICRTFAVSGGDKFAGLTWRAAPSGAPVLENVVAWVDCSIEDVTPAGDHYFVLGRVTSLEMVRSSLPLLFFRNGFGSFLPLSFAAADSDLLGQVRYVEIIRPVMEDLAREMGVECVASALVGGQVAYIGHATGGRPSEGGVSHVGWRLPFSPPVGATFAAWGGERGMDAWIKGGAASDEDREVCRTIAAEIRRRGYSVGVGHDAHSHLWRILSEPPRASDPVISERVVPDLLPGYIQDASLLDGSDGIETISVPVFGARKEVLVQMTIYSLPGGWSREQFAAATLRMVKASAEATRRVGGHAPESYVG